MTGISAVDNGEEGLYIKDIGLPIEIRDSVLTNNTFGIRLARCIANVTVASVISQWSRDTGIFSDQSEGLLNVTGVTLAESGNNGLSYIKTDTCKSAILNRFSARELNITSCEFRDNRENGVKIYEKCGLPSVIYNTRFIGNGGGINAKNDHSSSNIAIEKCTLINQTEISLTANIGGNATIRNNEFTNNRNSCLDIVNVKTIHIERNVFTGTAIDNPVSWYVWELKTISAVVILRNKARLTFRHNQFNNPGIQFQLATTVRDKVYALDARFNYWGSADINVIADSLYGYHHQDSLAEIIYHPYLESADEEDYNNASRRYPDVVQGHTIGGIITDKVELNDTDTPYHVTKDITVSTSGSLVVGEGVTLEFEPGRGIRVMGTLQIQGSSSNETILKGKQTNRHPRVRLWNAQPGKGTSIAGVVQVYAQEAWRSVCYSSSDKYHLDFICRAAGYGDQSSYTYQYVQDFDISTNSLSTFRCRSGRFSECEFPEDRFTNCSSGHVLQIYCERSLWSGVHLTAIAHPSIIQHVRLYETNYDTSHVPSHAAVTVDFLRNHVVANLYIENLNSGSKTRGLVVSRVGSDSKSIDAVTVFMHNGIGVLCYDSRINLNDLNITGTERGYGTGVSVNSKYSTTATLRNAIIAAKLTDVTSVHLTANMPWYLHIYYKDFSRHRNYYVYFTAPEGERITAEVVLGSFPSSCSAEEFFFYDGLHNETSGVGVKAGPDGTLFRSTGSTAEIRVRRTRYSGCVNADIVFYSFKGKKTFLYIVVL